MTSIVASTWRSRFLRHTGVFGKEVLRSTPLVLALAAIALALPPFAQILMALAHDTPIAWKNVLALPPNYITGFMSLVGLAIGLMLTTDEEELRTRAILDRLPGKAGGYVLSKFLAGVWMLLLWLGIMVLCYALLGLIRGESLQTLISDFQVQSDPFEISRSHSFLDLAVWTSIAVSVVATSMVAGALVPSVAGAAVTSAVTVPVFYAFCWKSVEWDSSDAFIWFAAILSAISLGITWLHYQKPIESQGRIDVGEALSSIGRRSGTKSRGGFIDPVRDHLRLPTLIATGLVLLPAILFLSQQILYKLMSERAASDCGALLFVCFPLAGAILGMSAWIPAERFSTQWFGYTLPLSRRQLFLLHMVPVMRRAVALGLLGIAAFASVYYLIRGVSEGNEQLIGNPLPMACLASGLLFSVFTTAVLVSALSLLNRLKLLCAVLGVVLSSFWCIWGTVSAMSVANVFGPWSLQSLAMIAWEILLLTGMPLLFAYLVFCGSPVTELPDSRRTFILIPVYLFLLSVGTVLVSMSPLQLITNMFL